MRCTSPHHEDQKIARHDARGIFLAYTCPDCDDDKMGSYRDDVLTDPNYWHDEPIYEDQDPYDFDIGEL